MGADILDELELMRFTRIDPIRENAILKRAKDEIGRLRGELAVANECLGEERAANVLRTPAPAMPNVVEAARVLADFAETAPGRLPGRVQEAIATIRAADNRDAAGVDSEEDAYVIERMGKLLAEIAVIVNGPEPDMTRWSYHDLPEKVRALKTAPAAVPAGEAVAVCDGWAVIEAALARAVKADPADAPFGTTPAEASVWHAAQASAYQHALEMIERTPQPADGEAVAYRARGMSDAWVYADKPVQHFINTPWEPLYTHPPAAQKSRCQRGLADDCCCNPEACEPPAPVQAAPQEGDGDKALGKRVRELIATATEEEWGNSYFITKVTEAASANPPAAHPSACELGADDVGEIISRDKRVWALAGLAEKCGAVKDEGESGLFWTLTLGDFYKLEAALQHRGDSRGGES